MARTRRIPRLTAELVSRVPPHSGEIGPLPAALATDDDHLRTVDELIAGAPTGDVWVFAYGSLIWDPACEVAERRVAVAHGWRRTFCLGWDQWFRGCPDRPGLMLALERGGQCKGVACRLPADTLAEELLKLSRRELRFQRSPQMALVPRWIGLRTPDGPLRSLAFVINPASQRYVRGLPPPATADVLARACGPRGSMAQYLSSTVSHLHELGIHDSHLWHLQDLVADRLEAAQPETPRPHAGEALSP